MIEKETEMKLKVDLQCPSCYKKVKKILCKFPQIKDQVYDEENNIVKIIVVCCSPEKIRDKLCCKGRKVIKSIEIVEDDIWVTQEKPPEPEELEESDDEPEEKPSNGTLDASPPNCPKPQPVLPVPVEAHIHIGVCCTQCYGGHPGGPCYHGYGRPLIPPGSCYNHYEHQYSYSYYRGCYLSRCDNLFSDENPLACSIM